MRSIIRVVAAAAILAMGWIAPSHANLVTNGDFATGDLTGWTAANVSPSGTFGGAYSQVLNGVAPADSNVPSVQFVSGLGFVAMDGIDLGFGAIMQTLHTVVGQTYQIDFVMQITGAGPRGGFAMIFDNKAYAPLQAVLFSLPLTNCAPQIGICPPVNSVPVPDGTQVGAESLYITVGTYFDSFAVTATSDDPTIEFISSCPGCNMAITDVSVSPVPEPGTMELFSIGLLVLGVLGWGAERRAEAK